MNPWIYIYVLRAFLAADDLIRERVETLSAKLEVPDIDEGEWDRTAREIFHLLLPEEEIPQ